MTTIICNRDKIVGDSLVTSAYGVSTTTKLFKLRVGGVVGISGTLVEGLVFVEWLKGDMQKTPPKMNEVEGILLRNGIIYHFDGHAFPMRVLDKVMAVGSGAQFALGAYYAGASLHEAVKIACKLDTCSGGRIKELRE